MAAGKLYIGRKVRDLRQANRTTQAQFAERIASVEWSKEAIAAMIKEVLAAHALKMPQIAMPLRLMLVGQLQTPAIDAVLHILGRDAVLSRLNKYL